MQIHIVPNTIKAITKGIMRSQGTPFRRPVSVAIYYSPINKRKVNPKNAYNIFPLIKPYAKIGVTAVALYTGANKRQICDVAQNVLGVF
jgi:hypothetical protein